MDIIDIIRHVDLDKISLVELVELIRAKYSYRGYGLGLKNCQDIARALKFCNNRRA